MCKGQQSLPNIRNSRVNKKIQKLPCWIVRKNNLCPISGGQQWKTAIAFIVWVFQKPLADYCGKAEAGEAYVLTQRGLLRLDKPEILHFSWLDQIEFITSSALKLCHWELWGEAGGISQGAGFGPKSCCLLMAYCKVRKYAGLQRTRRPEQVSSVQ